MIHDTGYYHVFPFQKVGKGEHIIIWGMGEVGKQYLQQVKKTDYCHISFCVDKGWESMSKYMDVDIMAPEKVRGCSERIVIANGSEDVAGKIKKELARYGIRNEKVLHDDLICENRISIKENVSKKHLGRDFIEKNYTEDGKDEISVAFYIHGGLGDILININYILAFYNKFQDEKIKIELYIEEKKGYVSKFLPANIIGIDKVIFDDKEKNRREKEVDLFIHILRYPWVRRANLEKMARFAKSLAKYVLMLKSYEIDNPRYYGNGPAFDGVSVMESEIAGIHRINQCDVNEYLSIGNSCYIKFPSFVKEMKKLNLPDKYITINRDVDSGDERQRNISTLKLWPTKYYNKLIRMIKEEYPAISIVVVGANCDPEMTGYDIDLVGKTTALEIEAVLKNSSLHISSEGGTVHLRHLVGGGMSVVMFGPTSPKFYGYAENVNLRSSSCEHPCEWTSEKWVKNCINKFHRHKCMLDLTPEFVMGEIKKKWVL